MNIHGLTYTESNDTATYVLTNQFGCDSIIYLNLGIMYSTTGTDVITACNEYIWIDGETYTENNNTATYAYLFGASCDSVVTLNLTIISTNVSLTVNDPIIISNTQTGDFQWLDCLDDYSIIEDETNALFTAIENGEYAVQITNGICTDTSECVSIITANIEDNIFNQVIISPNPSNGNVKLDFGDLKNISMHVFSIEGKLVYSKENISEQIHEFYLDAAPGAYFIELEYENQKQQFKLIRE